MRAFLSPFLPISQFCETCFQLAKKSGGVDGWVWWRHELSRLPPLGRFTPQVGFVPDYPVLLMFDEFVIDGVAAEQITRQTTEGWLGPWPEILLMLASEGALRVIDLDSEMAAVGHNRSVMTRADLRDPGRWADAMRYHDSVVAGADSAFRQGSPTASSEFDWTFDPQRHGGWVEGADGQSHIGAAVLAKNPDQLDDIHKKVRERALGDLHWQLREVNAVIATAARLDATCWYWAPYAKYLEAKRSKTVDGATDAARLFFELAFPLFRPTTVHELGRLRADRRVADLRQEIRRAYESGAVLDREYPQRVMFEVLKSERTAAKKRRIMGWLAAPVSWAVPALGIAPSVVSEGIGAATDRVQKRPLDWFYLISDGVGMS